MMKRKQAENRSFALLFTLLTLYHICLQSNSVELEHFTAHCDCFIKVSVQFQFVFTGTSLEVKLVRS